MPDHFLGLTVEIAAAVLLTTVLLTMVLLTVVAVAAWVLMTMVAAALMTMVAAGVFSQYQIDDVVRIARFHSGLVVVVMRYSVFDWKVDSNLHPIVLDEQVSLHWCVDP